MKSSTEVRDALLNFYDRLSAKDVESFDRIVSSDPATLVVGTAPGELVTSREGLRFGFETEGIALEAGDASGFEEGSMAWTIDQPTFILPDGTRIPIRLTAIFHKQDGDWRIVHGHFSVGVPDEEVGALVERWAT